MPLVQVPLVEQVPLDKKVPKANKDKKAKEVVQASRLRAAKAIPLLVLRENPAILERKAREEFKVNRVQKAMLQTFCTSKDKFLRFQNSR